MKTFAGFLAFVLIAALATSPAQARGKHHNVSSSSAYCANGKHVNDIKECKKNGDNK